MFTVPQKLTSLFIDIANAIRLIGNFSSTIQPSQFCNLLNNYQKDRFNQVIDKTITEITLEDSFGCYSIPAYTFNSCSSLSQASFSECITIGPYAFVLCTHLSQISFPECTTIEPYAFYACTSLSQASFPKCTTIESYAFSGCTSLKQIILPECITIENSAFYNCSNFYSLYLPGSSVCTLKNIDAFNQTHLNGRSPKGSIFVPASLVSIYKNDNRWSFYSSYITSI